MGFRMVPLRRVHPRSFRIVGNHIGLKRREQKGVKRNSHSDAGIGKNQNCKISKNMKSSHFPKSEKESKQLETRKVRDPRPRKIVTEIKREEHEQITKRSVRVKRPSRGESRSASSRHRITPVVPPPPDTKSGILS